MPKVWTFLAVEAPLETGTAELAAQQLREAARDAGGSVLDNPGEVLAARFPLAMDATRAVLHLTGEAGPASGCRAALFTTGGPDERAQPETSGLATARRLLREAHAAQILLGATTAALVGPALPADLELVDIGRCAEDTGPLAERIYLLRPPQAEPGPVSAEHTAPSNLGWAHRAAPRPVLGRDLVLAALTGVWQDTLRGQRRIALLRGEAGIGKTSAAAEQALHAHANGALVLYGRWDPDQNSLYQAAREAFGTYLQRAGPAARPQLDVEGHRDPIRRLLPAVGAGLGARPEARPAGDPEGERLALFDAVREWLDVLAAQHPVLLVWDDLHWADRSSQLLLAHLRRAGGSAPWTLLLTARPADTVEDTGLHVVELDGLDRATIAQLIQRTLGHFLEPDNDAVRWLATATAGNPLLVEHILRGIDGAESTAAITRELLAARRLLPEPAVDVIRWRVDRLPVATRRALAEAAVVGSTVEIDVVADVASTPAAVLRTALEPAVREHLLVEDRADGRYSFTHEVVRQALSDEVELERATLLHRRAALALEARAKNDEAVQPGEIAYHHLRGAGHRDSADAVRWARRAAEAAREATAFDEAVRLLADAVEVHDSFHLTGRDPDAEACELRLELAEAHDVAGHFAARDARFQEAAVLARRLQRTDLFARAALGFGGRLPVGPLPNAAACDLLEEALDRLPSGRDASRALTLGRLAHLRYFDWPHEQRQVMSDEAVELARGLEDPTTLARVLLSRSLALDGPDDVSDCLAAGNEITLIGDQVGDPELSLAGMRLRIPVLLYNGQHRQARQLATALSDLARRVSNQEYLRLATMWDIFWTAIEGRYPEVVALADQLADQLTAAGHPHGPVIRFAYTMVPRWLHGDLEPQRPMLDLIRGGDPDNPAWWAMSAWFDAATESKAAGVARLDERDPQELMAGLRRDLMWWPTMVAGSIAAVGGHRAWAAAIHQALLPHAGRLSLAGYAIFGGAVDHYLGTLALTLDRPDEAVRRLQSGLDTHRALGAVSFTGLTARWLAHALSLRAAPGDEDRAAALLDEAAALAERYSLAGLPSFDGPIGLGL